ncbi:hypothetical protein [Streptomyces sp. MB09-02B]|uniref:hypothetical protein n=1 Tax=Streptomyces sp. MB09-02B TaxID=3028667 RepID=UPI0029BF135C|nr:hypothetical protein [Streptomyces sp. MB09-02B]MDX3641648.1 hypothetical protein [Streptomyces sp. MB09-02B]
MPRHPATGHYFLANETRKQTINFTVDTGFPRPSPSTRASHAGTSANPSTHWRTSGSYFDEISAFTTAGSRSLTSGRAITMVDHDGSTLARPGRLNESAFKTVFVAA